MRISTGLPFAALLLPLTAGAFPYPIHSRTLDNGCQIVVVPMESEGAVATALWMRVGSRNEVVEGRTGFAHFFEHLAFSGSQTMSREEQERTLLKLGIADNAWTYLDETVYHAVSAPQSVEPWMTLQADILQNLDLKPEDVQREAGAVYGEYRKTQARPQFHLDQAVRKVAFTVHPYGHSTLGYEADIARMPDALEDALDFHAQGYRPDNAIVLLVGDIEADAGLTLLEGLYSGWTAGETRLPAVPAEPPQDGPRRAQVDWESEIPPQMMMAWRIPADDGSDPEVAALELVEALLLGKAGRLQNRLVREEGLAFSVTGRRDRTVDPGLFTVYVRAKPDADRTRIEAAIEEELANLVQGVDPALLERTRSNTRYSALVDLDDPANVLYTVGSRLRRGATAETIDAFDEQIAAVDAQAIAAVVEKHLSPRTRTIGWIGHGLPPLEPSPANEEVPDAQ